MKILHVDTGRDMRGGQIQALLLMEGLREAGHECLLMARKESAIRSVASTSGFTVVSLGLLEIYRQSRLADLVHAHDSHSHTLAAIASRAPFVISRRVAFPVKRSIPSKWKYQRGRRFLAVSQFVARELVAAGLSSEKIDVVYDGVQLSKTVDFWQPSNPAVALATADPQKGRTIVERAAHVAGIPVVFSYDLSRDFQNASMFVYITRSEGLGSAALLAMSMGIPVIASQIGGLTEVLEDGVSGLLVRNEPEEIATCMRRVRNNPAFAATLREGGRQRVSKMFTKQLMVERTITSYVRALAD